MLARERARRPVRGPVGLRALADLAAVAQRAAASGSKDPQFGKDISYFAFTYPFQRFVLGFVLAVLVLALLVSAVTHYLFGGVRLQRAAERVSVGGAGAPVGARSGSSSSLKAVGYWLDRYGLAFSMRGVVQGASYTDVHAVLPAKTMLAGIAVICALLFFANLLVRNVLLPGGALALLVISAVVVGGIYPAYVQQFQVKPNEVVPRDALHPAQHRGDARGVPASTTSTCSTTPPCRRATKERCAPTQARCRTRVCSTPTTSARRSSSCRAIRNYFGFNDALDVDRYTVDGVTQDYVVGVREIDQAQLRPDQQNWINLHLTYTHGNGFVAAPANHVTAEGACPSSPSRTSRWRAGGGTFDVDHPQIYYGEKSPDYSIVGHEQPEIDGPGTRRHG